MSHANYNQKISELLTALAQAAHQRQADDVLALLRVLRMNGLKDDLSTELVAAFTDQPQDADFELADQWAQNLSARHAPQPKHTAPPSTQLPIEDPLSQHDSSPFDDLEVLDIPADPAEFDELEAFLNSASEDEIPAVQMDDLFQDMDSLSDSSSLDLEEPPEPAASIPGEDESQLDSFFDSFDEFPTFDDTPQKIEAPTKRAFSLSENSSSAWSASEQEQTRQFDPAQLQALNQIPASKVRPHSPDDQDENALQRKTRDQLRSPGRTLFGLGPREAPPETAEKQKNAAPHLDPSAPSDEFDDFDFDFGFEAAPATQPSDEDDLNFDFGFEPSPPASDENEDEDENDLDFDFGFEATPSAKPNAHLDDDPLSAEMAYADPEDEFFFPPPLNMPSSAEEIPAALPEQSTLATDSQKTDQPKRSSTALGLFGAASKQNQAVFPLEDSSSEQDFAQKATPPRGTTPLPIPPLTTEGDEDFGPSQTRLLNEDELLALGEELYLSGSTSPRLIDPVSPTPEAPDSQYRYRGEPLLRGVGDEPTPAHTRPVLSSSDMDRPPSKPRAAHLRRHTPAETPKKPPHASPSFVLEELHPSPSRATSAAAAMKASLERARHHYQNAEFQQALELVEAVLELDSTLEPALKFHSLLQGELIRVQEQRLGALTKTPTLAIEFEQIPTLELDHRAGFILSQIDGFLTFEDILDISILEPLETLTLLADLLEKKIILAR